MQKVTHTGSKEAYRHALLERDRKIALTKPPSDTEINFVNHFCCFCGKSPTRFVRTETLQRLSSGPLGESCQVVGGTTGRSTEDLELKGESGLNTLKRIKMPKNKFMTTYMAKIELKERSGSHHAQVFSKQADFQIITLRPLLQKLHAQLHRTPLLRPHLMQLFWLRIYLSCQLANQLGKSLLSGNQTIINIYAAADASNSVACKSETPTENHMKSSFINCTLAITLGGFITACSSNPKPAQPEIAAATPPPPPPAKIILTPRGPSLTLDDVLFDFEQATLKPEASQTVSRAVVYLQENPDRKALIEGHTDHTGDEDYNQSLSTKRSDAISDALIVNGIDPARIKSVGFGETRPVANNETIEGRQSNRRVEIIFTER